MLRREEGALVLHCCSNTAAGQIEIIWYPSPEHFISPSCQLREHTCTHAGACGAHSRAEVGVSDVSRAERLRRKEGMKEGRKEGGGGRSQTVTAEGTGAGEQQGGGRSRNVTRLGGTGERKRAGERPSLPRCSDKPICSVMCSDR